MLTIEQYGIKLRRIQKEDIELIREWRNRKDISDFMEYKKHISRWAQKRWFKSINNKFNYYFIIEVEGKPVGVINAKNYVPKLRFAQGGIFIGEPDYIDSFIPVYSSLCLLNFTFLKLGFKRSVIKVLKNNTRAIQYNKLIGYRLMKDQEKEENQFYELSYDEYLKHSNRLNNAAARLNPLSKELKVSGEVSDTQVEELNDLFRA